VKRGDAATTRALIAAGAGVQGYDSPLKVATDATCRALLERHISVLGHLEDDPAALVQATLAHCAALSGHAEHVPTSALTTSAYHFDPALLWPPPAARAAVVAWAREANIAQMAGMTELPVDCVGDILEYFDIKMPRSGSECIISHCSSPKAHVWLRAVIAAADTVAVSICVKSHLVLI